ncbi:hypothetical protein K501DRAFT_174046 [Backusella circina FSU 941]|nr:hypothetical protein K501DRAFT_174046 [Backusella circina FSU 941]
MAENLSVRGNSSNPPTIHGAELPEDEESLHENVKAKLLPIDYSLTQTLSQRTGSGYHLFPTLSRHTTVASVLSQQFNIPHSQQYEADGSVSNLKSTFVQSVFNSVNVLVGIGVLALPLGFRCGGWAFGTFTFLFCTFATNYTAKLIARCLDLYPNSSTYADMGAVAFGDGSRVYVSTIFVIELMTIGVAMVVLLGDGIQTLFPEIDMVTVRIFSFIVLTPMLFLPIRKLAYTSLMGIISCTSLVIIVLYDGFSKTTKPGSLLDPMETEFIPSESLNIPLAFGLMMAGFSGHAVFPAIYRDMKNPKQYEKMVDLTYIITVVIYLTMAVAGYLMFGLDTMQEITQNLASTPGYSKWINRLAVWLIVITPLAKYGLMLNPVCVTWELWTSSCDKLEKWVAYHAWRRKLVSALGKVSASALVILIATVFPGFDRVMSLLGALFSFGISAIFPIICYIKLFQHDISQGEKILIYLILLVSSLMAILGTIWSFLP